MLPHFSATLNFPSFVLCRIRSFPDRGTGAPGKRSFRVPPHDNTHHQRKGAGLIVFVCAPAGACRLRTAPAPCCARTHANCLAPTVAGLDLTAPFPSPAHSATARRPNGRDSVSLVCVCVCSAQARARAQRAHLAAARQLLPCLTEAAAPLVSTRLAYMWRGVLCRHSTCSAQPPSTAPTIPTGPLSTPAPSTRTRTSTAASMSAASLLGDTLLTKAGETSTANALRGAKHVALYFSAHW